MNVTIYPGALAGKIAAPPSKSHAHRLLILSALADAKTVFETSGMSRDMEVTIRCLNALGANITRSGSEIHAEPMRAVSPNIILDCGESGSTLRFLMPLAAYLDCGATLTGEGRLPERPNDALLEALFAHGANASAKKLPMQLGGGLTSGTYILPGNVSSQYFTGLLFVLPLLLGDSEIVATSSIESEPYIEMTLDALKLFGARVERTKNGYYIPGNQQYRSPGRVAVEGDWSGAAFWVGANALGSKVEIAGLKQDSAQGDRAIIEIVQSLECVDVSSEPDLMPILSAVMAATPGMHAITGAARLRIKESDRLHAMAVALNAIGGDVEELPDGLVIRGRKLSGGRASGFNDHRVVMSLAVAATASDGPVTIEGAEAADKSYPAFFQDFARLGGKIDVEHHRE